MEHPLSQFKYCPKCGSAHFEVHNEKSKQCADCGFVYYFNPSSATVALTERARRAAGVPPRQRACQGTLDPPGGFIDMTETGEEGVAREVREETGMKVAKAEYLFSYPIFTSIPASPYTRWICFSVVRWRTPCTSRRWTTRQTSSSSP